MEAELTRLTDKEKEGKEETQTVLGAGEIAQPVEVFAVMFKFPISTLKLGMVKHACNPRTTRRWRQDVIPGSMEDPVSRE